MIETHVYDRQVNTSSPHADSLSLIYSKIQKRCRVLDIGAGDGGLGKALKKEKKCEVHGVTYNLSEYQNLKQHYSQAWCVDLETQELPEDLVGLRFDWIVCADVLEHLRNAHEVLGVLLGLLDKGGKLILSIPNVTYAGTLLSLLGGRFPRTREGILDSTHVHFFDQHSLQSFCTTSGATVVEYDCVRKAIRQSEYNELELKSLPPAVRRFVEARADSDVYQHVWTLIRSTEANATAQTVKIPESLHIKPDISLEPTYAVKVYCDTGPGFSESVSDVAFAKVDGQMHTLEFDFANVETAASAVRIDWPEVPISLLLDKVVAYDAKSTECWEWNGSWSEQVRSEAVAFEPSTLGQAFTVVTPLKQGAYSRIEVTNGRKIAKIRMVASAHPRESLSERSVRNLLQTEVGARIDQATHATFDKITQSTAHVESVRDTLAQLQSFLPLKISSIEQSLQQSGATAVQASQIESMRDALAQLQSFLPLKISAIEDSLRQSSATAVQASQFEVMREILAQLQSFLPPKISAIEDSLRQSSQTAAHASQVEKVRDSLAQLHNFLPVKISSIDDSIAKAAHSLNAMEAVHRLVADRAHAQEELSKSQLQLLTQQAEFHRFVADRAHAQEELSKSQLQLLTQQAEVHRFVADRAHAQEELSKAQVQLLTQQAAVHADRSLHTFRLLDKNIEYSEFVLKQFKSNNYLDDLFGTLGLKLDHQNLAQIEKFNTLNDLINQQIQQVAVVEQNLQHAVQRLDLKIDSQSISFKINRLKSRVLEWWRR
jgi:2-polyprenyl-3-methyl-5-hydroxy-6-metoxy-1,4-benzoquinol methylase